MLQTPQTEPKCCGMTMQCLMQRMRVSIGRCLSEMGLTNKMTEESQGQQDHLSLELRKSNQRSLGRGPPYSADALSYSSSSLRGSIGGGSEPGERRTFGCQTRQACRRQSTPFISSCKRVLSTVPFVSPSDHISRVSIQMALLSTLVSNNSLTYCTCDHSAFSAGILSWVAVVAACTDMASIQAAISMSQPPLSLRALADAYVSTPLESSCMS